MNYLKRFIREHNEIISKINIINISALLKNLVILRKNKGRLFIIGIGGSGANASHAVNDFRKLCNIESYAPTDNVAELTARTNDEGWENVFKDWLLVSRLQKKDALLFFSVGGGSKKNNVSVNLIKAAQLAKQKKSKVFSIIGKKNGYLKKISDCCILIPEVNKNNVTPHSEYMQVFIWHMLISHPLLKYNLTKWEHVYKIKSKKNNGN
jgi:D-sedoheptulose 7-phosphate isomerase